MWAMIPFFASLVLFGAFVGLRVWEVKRGRRLFETIRARIDQKAVLWYRALVMGSIPTAWRHSFLVLLHALTHRVIVFFVEVLRAVERPLTRLLHYLRTRAPSANGRAVSPFLKNITPEKKPGSGNGTTPPPAV